MKLFIYRTFTWTVIATGLSATSFLAGAITMQSIMTPKKSTLTEEHLPQS